jgi:flagellar motility protein MotE (MotC chaperone)
MKKKTAADILNLIKPEKAQIFAERFTGYRAPANQ